MLAVVGPTIFCLLHPEISSEALLCSQIMLILLFMMHILLFLVLQKKKSDTRYSFVVAYTTNPQNSVQTGKTMPLTALKFPERIKMPLWLFADFVANS